MEVNRSHKPPRNLRLASVIRNLAGSIIQRELKDQYLTITDVRVSEDLKYATLWISSLKKGFNQERLDEAMETLVKSIKQTLRKNITTKYIPKVTFKFDTRSARQDKIDQLIKEI